ncbi:PTS sugar transporter subunit IIA [Paraliobacillus sediminis]|uniref:PTS sugar transporter subunit IIA n=1 Tax=Paraliobacillus sediminis TaxID=1885916 RepID=UPI000E3E0ACF|nr:PTS glucose transporter subunit IIA [Paraliobacillus sediminis]
MFGLFKNKNKVAAVEEFIMPIEGEIIDITEVEDPVFSEKMMGDGFAIIPATGSVISPVDGEIVSVFPTKHAIGIKSVEGYEILIHVGLDTVQLNGEGFTALVKDGEKIKAGQEILQFDLEIIKKKASSYVVPVVFTDSTKVSVKKFGKTAQGERDILSFD